MNNQLPTLLIVEDDENDFLFLQRALANEQFEVQVQHACDGVEAIEYLAGENDFANRDVHPLPNLMVLDLKMPRKNGFEVLAWLREHSEIGTLAGGRAQFVGRTRRRGERVQFRGHGLSRETFFVPCLFRDRADAEAVFSKWIRTRFDRARGQDLSQGAQQPASRLMLQIDAENYRRR